MLGTSKSVWGFDPRSVPGCSLWLDGADSNSMTLSGSNVTAWTDKSPLATAFTLSNGSGGSTIRTTYTGLPVVQVSNSCFFNASYSYPLATRSIFFVMAETVHSDWRGLLSFASNADQSDYNTQNGYTITATNTVGSNVQFSQNFGNGGFNFNYNASNGTKDVPFQLYEDVTSNTAVTLFITGSNVYSSNTSVTPLTSIGLTVGGRNGIPNTGALVIAEVLLYSNVLTTSQRQQVEGYLAHKWGLNGYYDSSIPLSIPGCQLWLDAADASTITGTTSVTAWSDKSGNSNNPTIFGSPNITVGTINNVKAMWFNGTSGTWGAFSNSGATVSGFAVGTMNSGTAGYGRIIGLGNNPGNDAIGSGFCSLLLRKDSTQGLCTRRFDTDYTYSSYTYDTPFLASVIYDGTNGNLYINGATIIQFGSTGNFGYSNYSVGCGIYSISENTIDTWKGYVGEVILYRNALTTTQRQSIEGYLARKWGLTSMYSALPSIHPFSSIRPHLRTFQPTDIPGCQLWLDAADSSTLVLSGSNVTQWNDKSGNGRNVSASSSYPTFTTNGILFNGATPNVLSNAASFPSTTALNSFVVFRSTVASTRQRVFVYSYSGQNRYVATDTTFNSISTNASQGYGPVSYSPNTTYIYSANTYTGSSISHSENGVESSYQL